MDPIVAFAASASPMSMSMSTNSVTSMDGYTIGDRVEVWWNGDWYEGTLIGLPDPIGDGNILPKQWRVRCDMDRDGEVTTSTAIRLAPKAVGSSSAVTDYQKACDVGDLVTKAYQPGDLVEAVHKGGWYPAKIVSYKGNNVFEINWEDGAIYDSIKTVREIRLTQAESSRGLESGSQSGGSLRFKPSSSSSLGASLRMSTPTRQRSVEVYQITEPATTTAETATAAFCRLTAERDRSWYKTALTARQSSPPRSPYTARNGPRRSRTPPPQESPGKSIVIETTYGQPAASLAAKGAVRAERTNDGYRYVASPATVRSVAEDSFQPGDHVEARHSDGNWYKATIAEHRRDSIYEIRWDDGAKYDLLKSAADIRHCQQVQRLLSPVRQTCQSWPSNFSRSPSTPSRAAPVVATPVVAAPAAGSKTVECRSEAPSCAQGDAKLPPTAETPKSRVNEQQKHDTPLQSANRSRSERRTEVDESYTRWTFEASLAKAERARMMQGVKRTFDFSGPQWMQDAARFGGSSMSVAGFHEERRYTPHEEEPRFGGIQFSCFDDGDRGLPRNGGGGGPSTPTRERSGFDVLERNFQEAMDALEQLRKPWPLSASASATLSSSATGWVRLPVLDAVSVEPDPVHQTQLVEPEPSETDSVEVEVYKYEDKVVSFDMEAKEIVLPETSETDARKDENRLASFGFDMNPSEFVEPSLPPKSSSQDKNEPANLSNVLLLPKQAEVPSSLPDPKADVEVRPESVLRAEGVIKKTPVDESAQDMVRAELAKLRSWYSTLGDKEAQEVSLTADLDSVRAG